MRLASWILAGASLASAADSPLADSARKDDLKSVRALLDRHAAVNLPQVDGTTALHWSVRQDDLEMSRLLLKAGANPSLKNSHAQTALDIARDEHTAAFQTLRSASQ